MAQDPVAPEEEEVTDEHPLREPLPPSWRRGVKSWLEPGEEMLATLSTELRDDGAFGVEWLIISSRRLAVFDEAGGLHPRLELRLADLDGAGVRTLRGTMVLLAHLEDQTHTVIRFTGRQRWRMRPLGKFVENAVGRQVLDVAQVFQDQTVDAGRRNVCPTCGRIIRPYVGTCMACLDKKKMLQRLFSYLRPYVKAVALSLGLLVISTVVGLLPPILSKSLIDDVLVPATPDGQAPEASFFYIFGEAGSVQLLMALVVGLLLINVVSAALQAWKGYVMSWLGQKVIVDLSNETYSHMQVLDLSFFHRERTGRVMARITNDVQRLQDFISSGLQEMLEDILTLVIIAVILFNEQWRLAALVLLPVPLLIFLTQFFRFKLRRVYGVLWKRHASISAILADTIPGIRVVKAFVQERNEIRRFKEAMQDLFGHEMQVVRLRTIFNPSMTFITYLGIIIVWWVGGLAVMGHMSWEMSLGALVMFTQYMNRFFQPVQHLLRLTHRFERAATSAERVFEVLDTEPEVGSEQRHKTMPAIKGRVVFADVTFGYEPEEMVLKEISFDVRPGEMIGLVGHSGAGKTTIMNLICHFYVPDEGRVLVDGHNLAEINVRSYRSQLGVVSQEPYLFNGSVAANIAYGRPDASLHEIIAAAKAANAHEFIAHFPQGYDTRVGERGVRVSGGERQRLSIARAILKNPRILLLDEATSSVDTETEEKIQEALGRLIAGRTTFAIAHRLSTLKHASRLFVIARGRLVESGTHDELVAMNGIYAGLCEKQQRMSAIKAWSE